MIISNDRYIFMKCWVHEYINKYCIVRNKIMPGKLPGTYYTWIFYLRNGLFNHLFLNAVSQMFLHHIEKKYPNFDFQISGIETAATPMLAGIPLIASMYEKDINSFVVRKKRKEYGLKNIIEGIPNNKPIIMIDDLCNSGYSLRQCYDVLISEKLQVANHAFTIINKSKSIHSEQRQKSDMYLPNDIEVISLFDLDDFNLDNPSH